MKFEHSRKEMLDGETKMKGLASTRSCILCHSIEHQFFSSQDGV